MIAVLDYGIGNLRSAEKAIAHLGVPARLTSDRGEAARAAGVVLPGVGAFGRCMEQLRACGLEAAVHDALDAGRPFLGICVGMQMLFESSEEAPDVPGIGALGGTVRRLSASGAPPPSEASFGPGLRVPHMGWNTVEVRPGSQLFAGLPASPWLYFVHSYAAAPADDSVVAGTTEYGGRVVAAVERGPLWATQFHPEKSAANGLHLLSNFVRACGFEPAAAAVA